jgi:hypothetical protein
MRNFIKKKKYVLFAVHAKRSNDSTIDMKNVPAALQNMAEKWEFLFENNGKYFDVNKSEEAKEKEMN